ncbi:endolytic transglycosylase MltG [Kineococcus sp. R8]|uniref:endolytic transglycosylase MltG n=1 Tax=Kineococcus siccus TaxID=2696567 RepID=UPI001412A90B|nr:endolytic transglycosylase MltG [Kineococcus siccus]NAZ81706.1 endolytic transglycosylase MltG [Kineococcus siccus]
MDLTDLPGSSRPDGHGRRQRRRVRRRRTLVVVLVALALLGGGTWAAWGTLGPLVASVTASDDYEGAGTGQVDVRVAAGDTGTRIGATLAAAGVVKSQSAFVKAATAQPDTAGIQPGTYRLKKEMSGAAAVALLLDPAARITTKLTIPEGLRATQVLDRIAEQTPITRADLDAALQDPAALGLPPAANGAVEGYLFPATWDVNPDETAVQLLSSMVARTNQALAELGVPADAVHDVVVKASIAQKEARTPEDMAKVVTVLDNRLAADRPLQLDSTVSYAVNGSTVTTTEAERATDSPYNTYRNPGLPVGPISNPGEDALRAAINPEPGPWLYFVTVNLATGETRFATTDAEHAANVQLFRQYLRENPQG